MTYSPNDYAADTLDVTLETIAEAREKAETDEEREAIDELEDAARAARDIVLEREAPTPNQQLAGYLEDRR